MLTSVSEPQPALAARRVSVQSPVFHWLGAMTIASFAGVLSRQGDSTVTWPEAAPVVAREKEPRWGMAGAHVRLPRRAFSPHEPDDPVRADCNPRRARGPATP
ncbi:hypothetical protein GCM10012319_48850 [Comamonas sp. KCTC 72670]|nr:hypothetical protein GCM10012319_48850 [Comamonas sp. KCTC 72670]